jgi:FKBP-type peptidyl-prolyl cis-trans isomerase FkpA/FKBP-type peptidyl-prolyl cis-trans isomerase FklB
MGFLSRLFGRVPAPEFVLPAKEALTVTPSGLAYEVVREGAGDPPGPMETVTVHYAGWLTNGRLFDSSHARGKPISFPLNRVIAGWTEGLQLMRPGAAYRFVIPPELAYGARGAPPSIGPDETLVFLVELASVG